MLASDIITEVGRQLNDVNQITWSESAIIDYINSAQQMIVSIRPDAYSIVTSMQMDAGSKQSLPVEAIRLLNVSRNLGADGLTPGRVVHACEIEALDLFDFDWNTDAQVAAVKNYTYSEKTPNTFYVDPPSDGTGYIEISISRVPPAIIANYETLALKDIYENHIIQWCMFRAYSIEVDSASSQQRAAKHEQSFFTMMGRKFQRDVLFSPSVELKQTEGQLEDGG